MPILVTGAAGFIGYHVCAALLDRGERVVGVDNLNDYYDPALKRARLDRLAGRNGFSFHQADVCDREASFAVFDGEAGLDRVVHLAAQAGVRYSLENPYAYVDANVMGQLVVLEACRRLPDLRHLVYASSSSVDGANEKLPFAVEGRVDDPVSLYAATKRAGELIAECYGRLYRLPMTGLRFFTVYGLLVPPGDAGSLADALKRLAPGSGPAPAPGRGRARSGRARVVRGRGRGADPDALPLARAGRRVMRVLVTGANGFVERALGRYVTLSARGGRHPQSSVR